LQLADIGLTKRHVVHEVLSTAAKFGMDGGQVIGALSLKLPCAPDYRLNLVTKLFAIGPVSHHRPPFNFL
jgi:hypothetical protein